MRIGAGGGDARLGAVSSDAPAGIVDVDTNGQNKKPGGGNSDNKTSLASLSMNATNIEDSRMTQSRSSAVTQPRNPVEAVVSALASLVASLSPTEDERDGEKTASARGEATPWRQEGHWRARACFPARLAAPEPSTPPLPPSSDAHELATTGSRVLPILGRKVAIYDFGIYVDATALCKSSSAGALRAAAPGALSAASAEGGRGGSSRGGAGGGAGGDAGGKRRNLSRFVPILPGVISGRRERRRQRDQRDRRQPPSDSRPSSSSTEDPALPFGAALRSADDVPMSLVVRSRRALPVSLLRAEYARILSRRIVRLGGTPDDAGLREMLSHFRVGALPPSARHRGILVSGFGSLAGLAGIGGIRDPGGEATSSGGGGGGGGALAKGAVIEFRRSPGGTLTASVDGEHVATVRSAPLLAAAVFDLYVGEEPVCGAARASAHEAVAAWVSAPTSDPAPPCPEDGGKSWFGGVGGAGRRGRSDGHQNRALLAGGPSARATSGAAVCDDECEGEDGHSCEFPKTQQRRKLPRWPLLGDGVEKGSPREVLG